jgi:hypothetical protein
MYRHRVGRGRMRLVLTGNSDLCSLGTGEVVAVHVPNFRHSPRVASGILGIAPPVTQQHLLKPPKSGID